jgi:hypothetical protein
MEIVGQCCDPAAWPRKRDQVPILRQAEWAQGPVSMGVENFALTSNPFPNRLSRKTVAIQTELSWTIYILYKYV